MSVIVASVYGVINDQITYTLSEEYFTKFKFFQFRFLNFDIIKQTRSESGIEYVLENPRMVVVAIGVICTWWVGLIAGIVLSCVALFYKSPVMMVARSMMAMFVILIIAFICSILGAVYAKLFINEIPNMWFIPPNVTDKHSFIMVGMIHNFSYIGGAIGIVVALVINIRNVIKLRRQESNDLPRFIKLRHK